MDGPGSTWLARVQSFPPLVCKDVGTTQPQAPGMREMNAKGPALEVKAPPGLDMAHLRLSRLLQGVCVISASFIPSFCPGSALEPLAV